MTFHLVYNWTDSWKWMSVQTGALVTVLNSTALAFPPGWEHYVQGVSAMLGALTMYGRLIQQTPVQQGMPDRMIHVQPGETVGVQTTEKKP